MSDTTATPATITVPPETQAAFSEMVTLILGSQSMKDSERQYWINLLPMMTEAQIKSLKDILDNEKRQLQAIDEKYSKAMETAAPPKEVGEIGQERKARADERRQKEEAAKLEDAAATESLLSSLDHPPTP